MFRAKSIGLSSYRLRGHLRLEPLEPRRVLDSTVVFNEIMYHPPGGADATLEWIELHNQMAIDMDISGWAIQQGVQFTFPEGTIVPGRDFLVVAADPAALQTATGFSSAIGPFSGSLSNAGETLLLVNRDGRHMNSIDYRDDGDWPVGADGSGFTLAKRRSNDASDAPSNWTVSAQLNGNPGVINFQEPTGGTTVETQLLVELDDTTAWRYNETGDDLGASWFQTTYSAADPGWDEGPALLGYPPGPLPKPLRTTLTNPQSVPPGDFVRTYYFQTEFTFNGGVNNVNSLELRHIIDDGAVFYLNGQELDRFNMDPGAVTADTFAADAVTSPANVNSGALPVVGLQDGTNLLSVEVHQISTGSTDVMMGLELSAEVETPPVGAAPDESLLFSEIPATSGSQFWLETFNSTDSSIELGGYVIESSGSAASYTFPTQTIAAGGYQVVTQAELGFGTAEGDRLFFYSPGKSQLLDARVVTSELRGRSASHGDRWLYPDTATQGSANSFSFTEDVVINEIMFHDTDLPATPGSSSTELLVDIDGTTQWRYNETGDDLGVSWYETTYSDTDFGWDEGPALLGFESSELAEPLRTTLTNPQSVPPFEFVRTYYFQTTFNFAGAPNTVDNLQLRHIIDDGAVFYLNGQEIWRHGIDPGPVSANDFSSGDINNAVYVGPEILSSSAIVSGTNVLSVEVHQVSSGSSDIVMGVELSVDVNLSPTQGETDEEWIELYHNGTTMVDLTGWSLSDAVRYDFPAGTTLAPGGYLVVAKNLADLASDPAINIVGQYSGSLSNSDENIELLDARGNPVDEVHYYDGGRWPELADGGGSSLELRDASADNSKAEAWAASDEQDQTSWQTYTFRQTASSDTSANTWNEFVFGMLRGGEVLIDDVSVVRDPDGVAVELLQNGSFESDSQGSSPDTWRIVGNHHGAVVVDPTDAGNRVLKLSATGTTHHEHNNAQTTFVGNTAVSNGREYEITFRAKWLSGSNQLNARFYLSRVAHTFPLDRPELTGTPGMQNSALVNNFGPTFEDFQHSPIIPQPSESVDVSVRASDPSGVASATLFWSIDGGAFNNTPMILQGDGTYQGTVPGQSSGTAVQFYVSATDSLGASSTYPAAGADSRAMFEVEDGAGVGTPIDTFRIITTTADMNSRVTATEVMSNEFMAATVIVNGEDVFYDIGVHIKGASRARFRSAYWGSYTIRFDPDNLFRGVHGKVGLDASGFSTLTADAQDEVLVNQVFSHAAGGLHATYSDLGYVISPFTAHNDTVIVQLSRFEEIAFEEAFPNEPVGTVFEYELIYYPKTTDDGSPEGLKNIEPNGVTGVDIGDLGDSNEDYRWNFLIKNNREHDDYSGIIDMGEAFDLSGSAFLNAIDPLLNVDQWLRIFAASSLLGIVDSYVNDDLPHNNGFYVPADGTGIMLLPWDYDGFSHNATAGLVRNNDASRMISSPEYEHMYYGHMQDIIDTTFNNSYLDPWTSHFGSLVGHNYSGFNSYVTTRSNSVTSQLNSAVPPVSFAITTGGGNNFSVGTLSTTLDGSGWIDVREIRLAGNSTPLEVTWTTVDDWQINLPLNLGANALTLEAYDFQGQLISTDSITITSTATVTLADATNFIVTEINYNPHDPNPAAGDLAGSTDRDYEYIELMNTSAGPINLQSAAFTDGVTFVFPNMTLNASERVLVVRNQAAFAARYGTGHLIAGEFTTGGLSNSGETLALLSSTAQTIFQFSYNDNDPWPQRADGSGGTLELIDPATTPPDQLGKYYRWRGSTQFGGSPGSEGPQTDGVVINEVLSHTDLPQVDSIELLNTTTSQIDLSGWYLSDADANFQKFAIPGATLLNPGELIVFDENDFNPNPANPGPNDFALSGTGGDDVWLTDPSGATLLFVNDVHFGAGFSGESFGRVPNGSGRLVPNESLTLGVENSAARVGPLVISEVNYHPGNPTAGALLIDLTLTSDDLEFIEIFNPSGQTVDLINWRLRGGVDYDFLAGTTLGAGQVLAVISFNPLTAGNTNRAAAFREHYGIDSSVTLVGGYQGQLNNGSDRITLQRADLPPPENPTLIPRVVEDELVYDDLAPWPTGALATGLTIHRTPPSGYGNQGAGWTSAAAHPGTPIHLGDADLDGDVDTSDLTTAIINFTSAGGVGKLWSNGDTDSDGDVDTSDLTTAIINFTGALNSNVVSLLGQGAARVEAARSELDNVTARPSEPEDTSSRRSDADANLSSNYLTGTRVSAKLASRVRPNRQEVDGAAVDVVLSDVVLSDVSIWR